MKTYKIKHKPTGLFFTPSRSNNGNLSKNGKIYTKKPSLKWVGDSIRIKLSIHSVRKPQKHQQTIIDYFKIDTKKSWGYVDEYFPCPSHQWEIIEIEDKLDISESDIHGFVKDWLWDAGEFGDERKSRGMPIEVIQDIVSMIKTYCELIKIKL